MGYDEPLYFVFLRAISSVGALRIQHEILLQVRLLVVLLIAIGEWTAAELGVSFLRCQVLDLCCRLKEFTA